MNTEIIHQPITQPGDKPKESHLCVLSALASFSATVASWEAQKEAWLTHRDKALAALAAVIHDMPECTCSKGTNEEKDTIVDLLYWHFDEEVVPQEWFTKEGFRYCDDGIELQDYNCAVCGDPITVCDRNHRASIINKQPSERYCLSCELNIYEDSKQPRQDTHTTKFLLGRTLELQTMKYRQYLTTPEWKARSRSAKEFAGNRCQLCNEDTKTLHTHHRTYDRRGCELPEDLIVLCNSCHSKHHDKEKVSR